MKTRVGASSSRLVVVGALCVLWLAIAAILYVVFVSRTDHTDFFPRWAGARIALFEARDPYSEAATRDIQQTIYGRLRLDTEDQQGFTYPAFIIPLLFPFWLLPMRIASALWSSLSVLMVIALVYVLGQIRRQTAWVVVCVLATAHILLVIFQGQMTLFAVACLGIAYWMYTQSRDVAAGGLLVFAAIKPELVVLPVAVLIGWAIWERRWKLVVTFLLSLLLILALSVVIAGFWAPSWLAQVRDYQGYAKSVWPVKVLYQYKWVSALACLILAGLASRRIQRNRDVIFAIVCVLNMVLVPQTLPYSLAALLLPVALIVLRHGATWAPIIAASSWGVLFVPYRIQMAAVPLIVCGLLLITAQKRQR